MSPTAKYLEQAIGPSFQPWWWPWWWRWITQFLPHCPLQWTDLWCTTVIQWSSDLTWWKYMNILYEALPIMKKHIETHVRHLIPTLHMWSLPAFQGWLTSQLHFAKRTARWSRCSETSKCRSAGKVAAKDTQFTAVYHIWSYVIYMYVYVYTYIYMYIYICIFIYIYVYLYIYVHSII